MDNIVETIILAQKGDKKALNELVEHFAPFVYSLAYPIYNKYYDIADYDDIAQEGLIGLLKAIERYRPEKDPSNGKRLLPYFSGWIKESLYRAVAYDPTHLTTSIDQKTGDLSPLSNILSDSDDLETIFMEEDDSYDLEKELRREELDRLISEFDVREKLAFKLRFGIDGEPRTLQQTGEVLNVSYETIRNMEAKVLEKLKVTRVSIKYV